MSHTLHKVCYSMHSCIKLIIFCYIYKQSLDHAVNISPLIIMCIIILWSGALSAFWMEGTFIHWIQGIITHTYYTGDWYTYILCRELYVQSYKFTIVWYHKGMLITLCTIILWHSTLYVHQVDITYIFSCQVYIEHLYQKWLALGYNISWQ